MLLTDAPLLIVWSHSAAGQTHQDASDDQDRAADPAHEQSGAESVPRRKERTMIGGKHNKSAVADKYHLDSSLPRSQTS